MKLARGTKRNGRIERQKRASRQYERLQARAGRYSKTREESITTEHEESIRQQILNGLIADKGGDAQISTATRILAEVIASDAAWLMVFNGAIDHIIQNNPKARQNPRGLSQLDGYKRGLDAAPRPAAQVVTRLHPSVTSAGTISALNPIIRPILRVNLRYGFIRRPILPQSAELLRCRYRGAPKQSQRTTHPRSLRYVRIRTQLDALSRVWLNRRSIIYHQVQNWTR